MPGEFVILIVSSHSCFGLGDFDHMAISAGASNAFEVLLVQTTRRWDQPDRYIAAITVQLITIKGIAVVL